MDGSEWAFAVAFAEGRVDIGCCPSLLAILEVGSAPMACIAR